MTEYATSRWRLPHLRASLMEASSGAAPLMVNKTSSDGDDADRREVHWGGWIAELGTRNAQRRQHGTDSLGGEQFANQRVWHTPIQDVDAWHRFECAQAGLNLRDHAAADGAIIEHTLDLVAAQLGQDSALTVEHT